MQCSHEALISRLCAGLFRSSKRYYVWKTGSTFAILAAALTVLVRFRESMWGLVGSAFLLGLFWQQGGWLAHDYLHHQVNWRYLRRFDQWNRRLSTFVVCALAAARQECRLRAWLVRCGGTGTL